MSKIAECVNDLLDSSERDGMYAVPREKSVRECMARMARAGELVSPAPGVFGRPEFWKDVKDDKRHLALMHAIAIKHPDWVFCGASAAVAHGLSVSFPRLKKLEVARGRAGRRSSEAVSWHYTDASDCILVDGLHVTSPEQTVADCLRRFDLADGLAVADSFIRAEHRDATWLSNRIEPLCRNKSGCVQALATAALADGAAESGGESVARAAMYELGFHAPELQVKVDDPLTGERPRVDFHWELADGTEVAGEMDGHDKYKNPELLAGRTTVEALSDERLRESRITRRVKVVRFSYWDVLNRAWFARLLESYDIPRDGMGWPTTVA